MAQEKQHIHDILELITAITHSDGKPVFTKSGSSSSALSDIGRALNQFLAVMKQQISTAAEVVPKKETQKTPPFKAKEETPEIPKISESIGHTVTMYELMMKDLIKLQTKIIELHALQEQGLFKPPHEKRKQTHRLSHHHPH